MVMSIVTSDMPRLPGISVKADLGVTDSEAHWIIAFVAYDARNELDDCIYATFTEDILNWTRKHPKLILKTIEFEVIASCHSIEDVKPRLWYPGHTCCSASWA
ncbi:unnamed protein product [Aspergillus oryzae RIB40]|uniref:DNA, SC010 n=1 Tax=Aspergillus oryzae (strain ATCC 42149 / RIB 40) TaxID=510516 RepID=Q2TX83_ASPOR|nr:unnamed protein product [Aspergillus oryzae RIB40]KOC17906.1 hypothetical protein AFLA70_306g000961 [Aspergillus flavus AF70]BAE66140.1 unnamed protein product [Aspergillus oryzae RIB40]